jgi:hypothetical protein
MLRVVPTSSPSFLVSAPQLEVPPPVVREHAGILVVRDDLIPGGTKTRVLPPFLTGAEEFVFHSPAYGYAQIALAHCCRLLGLRATVFVAKRTHYHPRTQEAQRAGAHIVEVPHGRMSVVKARAREYCALHGAHLFPLGFDVPGFAEAIADVARSVPVRPREVWVTAGSGALARGLALAWPEARLCAVRIGMEPRLPRWTMIYRAPERFEDQALERPPFPSCSNYDAKAWQFIRRHAEPGALFWNVAA